MGQIIPIKRDCEIMRLFHSPFFTNIIEPATITMCFLQENDAFEKFLYQSGGKAAK